MPLALRTDPSVFQLRRLEFWWSATAADMAFPWEAGRKGKLKDERSFPFRNDTPPGIHLHLPGPHPATRLPSAAKHYHRVKAKFGWQGRSAVTEAAVSATDGQIVTVSQCKKLGQHTACCQKRVHFQTLWACVGPKAHKACPRFTKPQGAWFSRQTLGKSSTSVHTRRTAIM